MLNKKLEEEKMFTLQQIIEELIIEKSFMFIFDHYCIPSHIFTQNRQMQCGQGRAKDFM